MKASRTKSHKNMELEVSTSLYHSAEELLDFKCLLIIPSEVYP